MDYMCLVLRRRGNFKAYAPRQLLFRVCFLSCVRLTLTDQLHVESAAEYCVWRVLVAGMWLACMADSKGDGVAAQLQHTPHHVLTSYAQV